jgi:hypothetical protein
MVGLAQPVSEGIEHDRNGDEQDAAKQQQRVSAGRDDIARYRAHNERQADADGKRYRQPGDIDGGDQKQVGDVEDRVAGESVSEVDGIGLKQVTEHRTAVAAKAAQREAPCYGTQQETNNIVPVEELKAIARAGFDGVGPGAPAEHGDKHEQKSDCVGLRLKH